MKYTKIISIDSITDAVLKADEFLKEYWGQELFYINVNNQAMQNGDVFEPQFQINNDTFSFFAYRNKGDYEFLKSNGFNQTPDRSEIFVFNFNLQSAEMQFYNSFETDERERQFLRLTDDFVKILEQDLPLIRIIEHKKGVCDVMCKYRRSEGRIGFSFMPYIDDNDYIKRKEHIWIYMSDFKILESFMNVENFDYTGDNDISKEEWILIIERMKTYNTDDIKVKAFLDYIVNWIETELRWANYIEVCGNL